MPITPPEEGNGRAINSGLHASTKVLKEAVWSDELEEKLEGEGSRYAQERTSQLIHV